MRKISFLLIEFSRRSYTESKGRTIFYMIFGEKKMNKNIIMFTILCGFFVGNGFADHVPLDMKSHKEVAKSKLTPAEYAQFKELVKKIKAKRNVDDDNKSIEKKDTPEQNGRVIVSNERIIAKINELKEKINELKEKQKALIDAYEKVASDKEKSYKVCVLFIENAIEIDKLTDEIDKLTDIVKKLTDIVKKRAEKNSSNEEGK